MVPAGREAFVLDAQFLGPILFEEIQRDVVEDREILGGVADADAGLVLVHRDIQHPVEAVLNRPMTADDPCEMGGIGRKAGEEEARLAGCAIADGAFGVDAQDAPQPRPAGPIRQPREVVGGPGAANLDPAVIAVDRVQVKVSGLELRRARVFGNCWLACELWRALGLEEFCSNACRTAEKPCRGSRCCGCWS